MEAAVERETPSVIAAAQLLLVSRSLDDERAAMRAHIGERMNLITCVAREKERLVKGARQERERMDLARDFHDIVMRRVLPRSREHAVALNAER